MVGAGRLAVWAGLLAMARPQGPACNTLPGQLQGHTQLQCSCSGLSSASTALSELINPELARLRPGRLVSHLMLAGCAALSLTLDLASLDRTAAAITDLSFEDIGELRVDFSSLQQSRMKFIFTNIERVVLSGKISDRFGSLDMFFRRTDRSRRAAVWFDRLQVDAAIRLLNFQDIDEVRVASCRFRSIRTLDIVSPTACHAGLESRARVPCTRTDLFLASRFEEPALYQATSSPIFIVGMILLVTVIGIVIVLGVYFRYQKNAQSWRVGLSGVRHRGNWFLRPSLSSQTPSPGSRPSTEMRGPSPISVVGEVFEPAARSSTRREARM